VSEAAYEQLLELIVRTDRSPPEPADARSSRLSPDAALEPNCLLVRMECWKLVLPR
jgi:hypothetical protein